MPFARLARSFLGALEPIAASAFFVPEVFEEYEPFGLKPFDGYVTARAAPMGVVDAAVVASAFYTFAPSFIARFTRFDLATPAQVTAARTRGAGRALRRMAGDTDPKVLEDLIAFLRAAVDTAPIGARPLFAGHKALSWPEEPFESLWHGANALREFRGDCHLALLVTHELDGPEAQVLHAGFTKVENPSESFIVRGHGWKPEDFFAAAARLGSRGLALADGTVTDAGLKLRAMIEQETDRLAQRPLAAFSEERCREALEDLRPIGVMVREAGGVPAGLHEQTVGQV